MIDGESLRHICQDPEMPSVSQALLWVTKAQDDPIYHYWADRYARARQCQMERLADDMIALADTADGKNAHAIRVMVDTRKWLMSKLMPKTYGDKVDLGITGDVNVTVKDSFK